jgi:hypothetical protein
LCWRGPAAIDWTRLDCISFSIIRYATHEKFRPITDFKISLLPDIAPALDYLLNANVSCVSYASREYAESIFRVEITMTRQHCPPKCRQHSSAPDDEQKEEEDQLYQHWQLYLHVTFMCGYIIFRVKLTGEWTESKTFPDAFVKKIKYSAPTDN